MSSMARPTLSWGERIKAGIVPNKNIQIKKIKHIVNYQIDLNTDMMLY